MATKIPQLERTEGIFTDSTGPRATPDMFGGDLSPLADGLRTATGTAANMLLLAQQADQHKKAKADSQWVTTAVMQERMHLSEWMSDPNNSGSDEFATLFKEYSASRMEEYRRAAPSQEAIDAFDSHMGDWVSRNYGAALHTTERTRINNSILSIDQQIADSLMSFRNAQNVPNTDPLSDLADNVFLIKNSITEQFGTVAKDTEQKLQAHLTKQVVLSLAGEYPAEASKVLNSSTAVDEETRRTLSNIIEQSTKTRDIVAEDVFTRNRKDRLVAVYGGKTTEKIPLDAYLLHYDKDRAAVMKAHDDALVDVYNSANSTAAALIGKGPQAQIETLSKLQSKMSTDHDKQVLEILDNRVRDNLKQIATNRVGWLNSNPTIAAMNTRIASAPKEQQAALIDQRNETLLKFQGNAPDGESGEFYLNLPSQDRHLLTTEEASSVAAQINKSAPSDAIKMITNVLSAYPNSAHQAVVFNDLVTIPEKGKGIRQEYQLAFQNRGAWWLESYVGTLANLKDVSQLDDEKKKVLMSTIESNPTWKQFQEAMIGDNLQRAHELEGFKSGIAAFSHALGLTGKDAKQATGTAVSRLIGETLGFARVNGRPLAVTRAGAKNMRSDEDIAEIGRKMSVALKYVDPRMVNKTPFPTLANLGGKDSIEANQVVRDIVTSQGFFVTANDGQSATLHLRDDNGFAFEVTDTAGKPFAINFDDLPSFQLEQVVPAGSPLQSAVKPAVTPGTKYQINQRPDKTYPLTEGGGMFDRLFGSGQVRTNWPASVPWLKNQMRPVPVPVPQPAPIAKPPPAEDPVEALRLMREER